MLWCMEGAKLSPFYDWEWSFGTFSWFGILLSELSLLGIFRRYHMMFTQGFDDMGSG